MPTLPLMQLPRTSSSEEFENMCKDVLEQRFQVKFQIYGRKGQLQNGVDILSQELSGQYIVAQCKNYYVSTYEMLQNQLEKDIESAKDIQLPIKMFIAMTSLSRDSKTILFIEKIKALFKIEIVFWEDIQTVVCGNPALVQKYYPDFFNGLIPVGEQTF